MISWYITHSSISAIYKKIFTPFGKKKECKQNNKKTLSIKMKEDVGMLKPKKPGNKVGRLT